jgi:thioesterase domain-containing protein
MAQNRMQNKNPSLLIPIQVRSPSHAEVFLIPGAGANVFGFIELVESLNLANSVYGLQPRGLDGDGAPHKSITEAAAVYQSEILHLQTKNPIHILGHSFGGWVALELGFRLINVGRKVESLIIVDSDLPDGSVAHPSADETAIFLKYIAVLEDVTDTSWGIMDTQLQSLSYCERLKLVHKKMVEFRLIPRRSSPDVIEGSLKTFAACLAIPYAPSFVYPNPTYLMVMDDKRMDSESNRARVIDLFEGWKRVTANLTFWHGPGNHMSALKAPHVVQVADWMRPILSGGSDSSR